ELTHIRDQPMAHERRVTKTVPGNLNRVGVHLTNNRSISSNSNMADSFEPTSPPSAPEPIPPNPNPPPEPPPRGETTQSTGLPSNIAAALACIPLVGGLIFWFLEKRDNFVRFYAMQSIIFGRAWFVLNITSRIVFDLFASLRSFAPVLVFLSSIIQSLVHLASSVI